MSNLSRSREYSFELFTAFLNNHCWFWHQCIINGRRKKYHLLIFFDCSMMVMMINRPQKNYQNFGRESPYIIALSLDRVNDIITGTCSCIAGINALCNQLWCILSTMNIPCTQPITEWSGLHHRGRSKKLIKRRYFRSIAAAESNFSFKHTPDEVICFHSSALFAKFRWAVTWQIYESPYVKICLFSLHRLSSRAQCFRAWQHCFLPFCHYGSLDIELSLRLTSKYSSIISTIFQPLKSSVCWLS